MAGPADGAAEFGALARRLKEAGETGLRRDLYKAISDAARPLAREIGQDSHLRPYMPNRYAATLASDMSVTVSKLTGRDPGVKIRAKGRVKDRKVKQLNDGILVHPLFGDRDRWFLQLRRMKAGFFDDPARRAAPEVRRAILGAVRDTARKITNG